MPETWNEAPRESGATPSWRRVPWRGGGVRSGGVRTSAPSSAPEGAGCGYLCQCPTPKHALSSTNTRHLFHCFTEAGSFWCVWGWGVRSPSAVETRWRWGEARCVGPWCAGGWFGPSAKRHLHRRPPIKRGLVPGCLILSWWYQHGTRWRCSYHCIQSVSCVVIGAGGARAQSVDYWPGRMQIPLMP